MKKGFTLIEMMVVLVIIGILMAATMNFGSDRIVDLKAQSIKEQFVNYYNELYNQNMTSRFRDQKKYSTLTIGFSSGVYYLIDAFPPTFDPLLSDVQIQNLRFASTSFPSATLLFHPYVLGCAISNAVGVTGDILSFDMVIAQNGKKYCFEIASETCKLVETKCKE